MSIPEPADRQTTRESLSDAGFDTAGSGSLEEARTVLRQDTYVDCLVTEYELPDGTGLELIHFAREMTPDTACILFTETSLDKIDTDVFGETVSEYLRKDTPNAHEELVSLVEHSLSSLSQTAYPLPQNEDARRAALKRYTIAPEFLRETLSRLTELATELFDANSAAVGLIDAHHERFLSYHGATFEDMPREETICTYAILEDDVTVIEDVQEDPRFKGNQGLAAKDICFYAGSPLVTSDGKAIGTFCIHDDQARSFSEKDQELLSLLADKVVHQLELHRRLQTAGGGSDDE